MAERRLRVVPAGFPESAQGGVVTLQDQMLTGKAVIFSGPFSCSAVNALGETGGYRR
jgi:hypothetical protein